MQLHQEAGSYAEVNRWASRVKKILADRTKNFSRLGPVIARIYLLRRLRWITALRPQNYHKMSSVGSWAAESAVPSCDISVAVYVPVIFFFLFPLRRSRTLGIHFNGASLFQTQIRHLHAVCTGHPKDVVASKKKKRESATQHFPIQVMVRKMVSVRVDLTPITRAKSPLPHGRSRAV